MNCSALVLASQASTLPTPFPFIVIAVAIGIRLLAGRFDRQRIREHVESHGGEILEIVWDPFARGWTWSHERTYDVTFKTHHGRTLQAVCRTSMFSGVYWISDAPPAGSAQTPQPSAAPAESIDCVACGAKIAPRQTHCPKCGWSYQASEKANRP